MYVVTTVSLMQVEASAMCGCYAWLAVATPCRSLLLAVGARSPAITWQRYSVALKPVMPSSLVTARAFNWHISLVTAHHIVFYRPRNRTVFFKFWMPRFLAAKCPMITICLLKLCFVFALVTKIQFLLTSSFLPAAWFPMFSASSIILSFSFAVNER